MCGGSYQTDCVATDVQSRQMITVSYCQSYDPLSSGTLHRLRSVAGVCETIEAIVYF